MRRADGHRCHRGPGVSPRAGARACAVGERRARSLECHGFKKADKGWGGSKVSAFFLKP